jgi:hypothetical protein
VLTTRYIKPSLNYCLSDAGVFEVSSIEQRPLVFYQFVEGLYIWCITEQSGGKSEKGIKYRLIYALIGNNSIN